MTHPDHPTHDVPTATTPDGIAHPRTIRSFVRRAGRTTTGQAKAFAELGPSFILPYAAEPLGRHRRHSVGMRR
jgi:tRNA (guanine-N7-)-methyltransferase